MDYKYTSILIYLLLILAPITTIGQSNDFLSLKNEYNQKYGLNSELYNGKKYYPSHTNAKGHPYLLSKKTQNGVLISLNKTYNNLSLKYNIYTQEIILKYNMSSGAVNQLVISNDRVDTLKLQNRVFIQNKFSEISTPLIQVIVEGKYSMYLSWDKDYSFKSEVYGGSHIYSKEKRKVYLVINSVVSIKNNKSFLNAFKLEYRENIKQFIKENKIKIKKASEFQLWQLMEYCNENI